MKVSIGLLLIGLVALATAYDLDDLIMRAQQKRMSSYAEKRGGVCPPWSPFQCPGGECIPIKYLCDGSSDCSSGYDEDERMCTAAVRPPVSDTTNFLTAMLTSHGPDFLAKIFGPKGAADAAALGGVNDVAVALSGSLNAFCSFFCKIEIMEFTFK